MRSWERVKEIELDSQSKNNIDAFKPLSLWWKTTSLQTDNPSITKNHGFTFPKVKTYWSSYNFWIRRSLKTYDTTNKRIDYHHETSGKA